MITKKIKKVRLRTVNGEVISTDVSFEATETTKLFDSFLAKVSDDFQIDLTEKSFEISKYQSNNNRSLESIGTVINGVYQVTDLGNFHDRVTSKRLDITIFIHLFT